MLGQIINKKNSLMMVTYSMLIKDFDVFIQMGSTSMVIVYNVTMVTIVTMVTVEKVIYFSFSMRKTCPFDPKIPLISKNLNTYF